MLITKTVQIEFANKNYRAIDCFADLKKAAEFISLNLYSRYGVQLQPLRVLNDYQVVMDIKIPEDKEPDFSIGNHLRGLSAYLLSEKCSTNYREAAVGKRLFDYYVLPDVDQNGTLTETDKLGLISDIVTLLRDNDTVSNEKIKKIMQIIHEEE